MKAAIDHRPYPGLPWAWRLKVLGILLVAALLIGLAMVLLTRKPAAINVLVAGGTARVGAPAPAFTTQTLDGATVSLSQFRGKPVLLNFWATWCAACKDEMPLIRRASDLYGAQGLTVLAVDYEQTDTATMKDFLRKVDARFSAVYDPAGRIAGAYGVTVGLPVSVFVDRAGMVSFIQVGQMTNALLEQHLQSIL